MIKYLVKATYTATEKNPNFKGETQTWFCGKENHSIKDDTPARYFVDFYGYSRKQDALRNYHMRPENKNTDVFWDKNVEVVEAYC